MDLPQKRKVIRNCSRCNCPGHRNTNCPVFIPKTDDEKGYIEEIQRIKKIKLIPISNVEYMKNWITKNGGSRFHTKLIYDFVKNQEIFNEDDTIIQDYINF